MMLFYLSYIVISMIQVRCVFVCTFISPVFFSLSSDSLFIYQRPHLPYIQNGNGTLVWLLNTRVYNFQHGFEGFPRICHIQFSEWKSLCKWNASRDFRSFCVQMEYFRLRDLFVKGTRVKGIQRLKSTRNNKHN